MPTSMTRSNNASNLCAVRVSLLVRTLPRVSHIATERLGSAQVASVCVCVCVWFAFVCISMSCKVYNNNNNA